MTSGRAYSKTSGGAGSPNLDLRVPSLGMADLMARQTPYPCLPHARVTGRLGSGNSHTESLRLRVPDDLVMAVSAGGPEGPPEGPPRSQVRRGKPGDPGSFVEALRRLRLLGCDGVHLCAITPGSRVWDGGEPVRGGRLQGPSFKLSPV